MTLKAPLFLQDTGYTASADRYMIGAGLFPRGGGEQYPRCGVRPFGVTSTADGTELSFKVLDAASVSGPGTVVVERGACYVPASSVHALNGCYLVVNDAPMTVNLAPDGLGAGTLDVCLYVEVLDPEDSLSLEGTSVAEVVWTVLPTSAAPSPSALLLARCLIPVSGSVDVQDRRTYTSAHGGTVIVDTMEELTQGTMGLVPFGSSAYVKADGLTYTRTKRGWEAYGAVPSGGGVPADAYEGQVFYNSATGQLMLFTGGAWVQVGGRTGLARKQIEKDYTGRRHAMVAVNEFKGKIGANTGWKKATSLTAVSGAIPTSDAATEVRFQVFSAGTLVVAGVTCEMSVKVEADTLFSANFGYVALELMQYSGGAAVAVPAYPFGAWGAGAYYYAGERFKAEDDSYKGRTVLYSLDPGEYFVRPMFQCTGTGGTYVLHVAGLCVEVAL